MRSYAIEEPVQREVVSAGANGPAGLAQPHERVQGYANRQRLVRGRHEQPRAGRSELQRRFARSIDPNRVAHAPLRVARRDLDAPREARGGFAHHHRRVRSGDLALGQRHAEREGERHRHQSAERASPGGHGDCTSYEQGNEQRRPRRLARRADVVRRAERHCHREPNRTVAGQALRFQQRLPPTARRHVPGRGGVSPLGARAFERSRAGRAVGRWSLV